MEEKNSHQNKKAKMVIKEIFFFSTFSIFVPLIVFGSIGFYLDKYFHKRLFFLLVFIGIAFLFTNFLLLKKAKFFNNKMKEVMEK